MNQIIMPCSMRTPKPLQAKVSPVQTLGWPARSAGCIVPPSKIPQRSRFNRAHVHASALPALEALSLGPPVPHPCSLQLVDIATRLGSILPAALTPSALAALAAPTSAHQPTCWALLANLATALQPSCFDAACQQEKDTLLLASLALPLLVFAAAAAYLLRPPPQDSLDDGALFEDTSTGTIFEAPAGAVPERDRRGELAFRAVSYTPWPVEEGTEGERFRIDVGPTSLRQPRTFLFSKTLPQPSQLVVTTLERPLGIVFEEDARRKRVVVAGFTPGGRAEQAAKKARLNTSLAASTALEGDVLRACTCTNIVYQSAALAFGAQPPTRSIVMYGADGQGWPQVVAALKKGLVSDGPVTLVLERRVAADGPV